MLEEPLLFRKLCDLIYRDASFCHYESRISFDFKSLIGENSPLDFWSQVDKDKRCPKHLGGMAEWFKAAVLKTVERKFRGFESYSLRQFIEIGYKIVLN